MTSFLRRHARDIKDGVIHLWWVFVIVVPLCGFVLFVAIDYANTKATRQERQTNVKFRQAVLVTNEKFRQALIISNRKFQQAILISTQQSAYAQNKSACGFRELVKKTRQRATATLADPKALPQAKAAARQSLADIRQFLETQVTVPSTFDCDLLPTSPPQP